MWKSSFSPESRDIMVGYCRKYTVGRGVGRGSCRGYRPWSCGDRAGALPVLAGGVVIAVGGTVFQMWALFGLGRFVALVNSNKL